MSQTFYFQKTFLGVLTQIQVRLGQKNKSPKLAKINSKKYRKIITAKKITNKNIEKKQRKNIRKIKCRHIFVIWQGIFVMVIIYKKYYMSNIKFKGVTCYNI